MKRLFFCFFLILCCVTNDDVMAFSKTGCDTLWTRSGDRIIVSYEYSVKGKELSVKLNPAIKRLGEENGRRYRKKEELTVIVFDRKGSYNDAVFSGDIIPEAFMVPSVVSYSPSTEGYYLLHESPTIPFRYRNGVSDVDFSFPVYLAYHIKKGRYKLISQCGSLKIKVRIPDESSTPRESVRTDATTVTYEIESDNIEITRVLDCIANINARLPQEDRLPMSESIEGDIKLLREWKYNVTDNDLKEKVNNTLDAYEQRKRELEKEEKAAMEAEQKKAEDEMKAQQESELAKQKEDEEKRKKRNVFMIIGGIVAAAGGVAGNHFLQNSRNKKNQKDMVELQQQMMKKVENEAKQKAQAAARTQMREAEKKVRGKSEETIKKSLGKTVDKKNNKNKRDFTI